MKKKFEYTEKKGLPAGPNEYITHVSGIFSTEGYKRNSPDVNNPFNIIPSSNITMEGVDFPVRGYGNNGIVQDMKPGGNYNYGDADYVFEVPMYKRGGGLLTKTMKCNNCSWSWKAADGGNDVTTCHKCGGEALPMAQEGGGVNKEGVNQYKWFKNYMRSPKYKERLKKEFSDYNDRQIEQEAKSRLQNIMQTRVGFLPYSSKYSKSIGSVQGFYDHDTFPGAIMLRPEYSASTSDEIFEPGNYLSGYNTIPLHEWSHAADDGGNRMPQSTTDLMLSKMKENISDIPKDKYYYTKPTEYLGRMQPLRYLMQQEGLYDAGTQDFTKEDLENAKQNKTIKNNQHFQDLMENVKSDEDFIELMNKVASVDNSVTEYPKAQNGREQATISAYEEPTWYEKVVDYLASPMTAIGYSARNKDLPDSIPINAENRNAFDSVIDAINPFAWAKYAASAKRNTDQGEYLDAGFDALGAIPVVPAWLSKGKKINKVIPKNTYKYNPFAYNNIDSKLPEFLQLNKENEKWLRQVGEPAIRDAQATGTVREIGEEISPRLFAEKLAKLKNQQTGVNFSLDKRYPGPFFKKGETFFNYNKKPTSGLDGKRNTRGRSGSADYLIEFDPSDPIKYQGMDSYFQPAYMQVMFLDPKPMNKLVGDIGIMKPKMRDVENFNFYKKDPLKGYRKTSLDKLQDGNGEYKVQSGDTFYGIANKNNISWEDLQKANSKIDIEKLKLNQKIKLPSITNAVKKVKTKTSTNKPLEINIEGLKKGIAQAESLGGVLMLNPESTATGLYGQRFSELKGKDLYKGTRDEFAKDIEAQNRIFDIRLNKGINSKRGLIQDAEELYEEYKPQIKNFDYTKEDLIGLTNFLGRQGTRYFLGYHLRDGKPLHEALPNIYSDKAKQANKTPYEYLEILRKYYQSGGEIDNLTIYKNYIDGVYDNTPEEKQAQKVYDKLNRVYYREAKTQGTTVPNYIMSTVMNTSND